MTKLEAEQLAEKPWQLTGEVSAKARPTNSLLEADMDYDQGSKAAPIITEEVCRHTPLHTHLSHSPLDARTRTRLIR